ncbi:Mce family protein [Gordonia effusa NBRC 100432]|uniref:Mce family protein n=1 Tax=Gordonia effusa NBRC 100432 TaxID=1077974 RepID=H0QYS2_9ACTN|nr:MCE family protein [Gordonia effusa]GAB17973.1 Mce family protein [Gordonia effusa NBRC 100432]
MQEVNSNPLSKLAALPGRVLARIVDKPALSNAQRVRGEVRWGIAAVILAAVIGLAAVGIYALTPGQYRITAQFAEAGQIRVGDNVRVAGIPVGAVQKVTLADDHVDVEMSVSNDVRIGSESRADVKMLTIVGGSFVDITSSGDTPLGDKVIPVDQTSIPYSLMETFQIAQPKLARIDATPLRKVLVEMQTGLSDNPGALRRDLTTMSSMLRNVNERQDEFGALLRLASDYTSELNVNGDVVTAVIRNLSAFISELEAVGVRAAYGVGALAGMLERVKGLALEYANDIDPLVRQVDSIGREFGPALRRYTPMIESGRALIKRLEGMVGPDGSIKISSAPLVLSSNICVPLPGMGC